MKDKKFDRLPAEIRNNIEELKDKSLYKPEDAIPELLNLIEIYPERSIFHISEFTGFTSVTSMYFNAIGERELAEAGYNTINRINPTHPLTKHLKDELYPSLFRKLVNKIKYM